MEPSFFPLKIEELKVPASFWERLRSARSLVHKKIGRQLKLREKLNISPWKDHNDRNIAIAIMAIADKYLGWDSYKFSPEDDFLALFWCSHEFDLQDGVAITDIEELFGIEFDPEKLDNVTFGEVIEDIKMKKI